MVCGGWPAEVDADIQVEMLDEEVLEFAAFADLQPGLLGGEGLPAHDHAVACSGDSPNPYPLRRATLGSSDPTRILASDRAPSEGIW